EPELDQDDAALDDVFLHLGAERKKALVLGRRTESQHIFDAGAIVPAPVEDHDLARGRKMLHVALKEQLRLLAIRWRRKGSHAKHARADLFRNSLDRAAFSGRVATFEQDDDPKLVGLHPFLDMAELDL